MEPYRTAEARWFRRGEIPRAVQAWFDGLGPAVEAESRTDHYLAPASAALGVKLREGQVEAKRRGGVWAPLAVGPSAAPVESWAKWSFGLAGAGRADLPVVPGGLAEAVGEPGGEWIEVRKTRAQRHAGSCALEVSHVQVEGEAWWSVCLEATGPDDRARRAALAEAARQWLGTADAPALASADAHGYPAWLLARTV